MDSSVKGRVGASIREYRKRAGLSISQLASMADMDTSFLNQVELGRGNPSIATLGRIAQALKVPPARFFERVREKEGDVNYKISLQLHSLFRDCSPDQKNDLIVILRVLRNRNRLKALRQIIQARP